MTSPDASLPGSFDKPHMWPAELTGGHAYTARAAKFWMTLVPGRDLSFVDHMGGRDPGDDLGGRMDCPAIQHTAGNPSDITVAHFRGIVEIFQFPMFDCPPGGGVCQDQTHNLQNNRLGRKVRVISV